MRHAMCAGLSLALLTLPPGVLAQPAASDPEVLEGITQVEDGEYGTAILTLDRAARRLSGDPDKTRDLSQAYLYLGIAYFGQGHEAASKANFRDAIRQFREISLNPELYPPAIINLFEAAREEAGTAAPAAAAAPAAVTAVAPEEKQGGSKMPLILGGVAALVGGGVAVAAGGGDNGASSGCAGCTVAASVLPTGTAIIHVTEATFTATTSNLSSPSFSWDFGDGASASGQTATHIYAAEGSFPVTVTATGAEGTVTNTVNVSARSVSGLWQAVRYDWADTLEISQDGRNVGGTWQTTGPGFFQVFPFAGTLTPDGFDIKHLDGCQARCVGTYNPDLTEMRGWVDYDNYWCPDAADLEMVFVRQ